MRAALFHFRGLTVKGPISLGVTSKRYISPSLYVLYL
jgi:hypothetical protein